MLALYEQIFSLMELFVSAQYLYRKRHKYEAMSWREPFIEQKRDYPEHDASWDDF